MKTKQQYGLSLVFLLCFTLGFSQVGIGNKDPKATLDITGQPTVTTEADGVLMPRLSLDQLNNKQLAGAYGVNQQGVIVYIIDVTAPSSPADPAVLEVDAEGFYAFDGTIWNKVSRSESWGLLGNEGTDPATNFIGTTDDKDLVIRTNNVERVRIDSTMAIAGPNYAHADLSLQSANRGLLLNRVALTSSMDDVTVGPHVAGMFVYNTAAAGDVLPGLYFNDGTKWCGLAKSQYDTYWNLGNTFFTATLHFIGTTNGQHFVWRTNDVERLRFDTSQDLGIGTTTPANRLHITTGVAGQSGLRTQLTNAIFIGTDANGDITEVTLPTFPKGSIKYSYQPNDHNGWIKLDGRPTNTFTGPQQVEIGTLLSISGAAPIPDATDRYLSQVGAGGLASLSGNAGNTITLAQSDLPNVSLTESVFNLPTPKGNLGDSDYINASGNHIHTLRYNSVTGEDYTSVDGGGGFFVGNSGSAPINANGNHSHTISVSINSGSQSSLNIKPATLNLNVFMYVGL